MAAPRTIASGSIDQVDHRSQPAGESVHIAPESRATFRIAARGKGGDLSCAEASPPVAPMIYRKRWPGKKSLDTAQLAAIARRCRDLVRRRPGHRFVAPFSGNRVGPDEDPSALRDPSADPGAENDTEDRLHAHPGAIGRFRQDKAISVVGQASWPARATSRDPAAVGRRSAKWSWRSSLTSARAAIAECRQYDARLAQLYDLYDHRIGFFAANPPGHDWDGVFVASEK